MLDWLSRLRDPWARVEIETARFVVLDLETTGLDVERDRMISAAAVAVRGGAIHLDDALQLSSRPAVPLRPESIPVHGMLPDDVRGGLPEERAVSRIDEFVGDDVVVGHHIRFDVAILHRAGSAARRWPVVDTAYLYRRLEHGPTPGYVEPKLMSLDELARELRVPIRARHTAAGDVLVTAEIWLELLARSRSQGLKSVRDLMRR